MIRLYLVGYLVSLAIAFHLGWWGRWRMNQKLKERAKEEMDKAREGGASQFMLQGIMASYWEAL